MSLNNSKVLNVSNIVDELKSRGFNPEPLNYKNKNYYSVDDVICALRNVNLFEEVNSGSCYYTFMVNPDMIDETDYLILCTRDTKDSDSNRYYIIPTDYIESRGNKPVRMYFAKHNQPSIIHEYGVYEGLWEFLNLK